MGQKIDPRGFRLVINKNWKSRWFGESNYSENLKQDILLREDILSQLKNAAISSVEIERSLAKVRVIICSGRPGVLIGRKGQGIEDLKKYLGRKYFMKKKSELQIDVKEVRRFEEDAQLLADDIAMQLEKRVPFRRVIKMALEKSMQSRLVKGIKVQLSGRLGGAEMSRREWLSKGNLPLHTLRADIDYAKATAKTTFGTIGVKVWLFKKEEGVNNFSKLS